ncbi:sulfatase family protein [Salegentibacter mishustinae]|uniref:Sulfatase n=1 Tax=Salegentibacter mishustinae TaxID=270918 RepID=A0A0Q9ZP30_9FLAO|nr:sulfatase [Salegentibacter mishustinae]KRG30679.1 sulfatase [Salegentibacter mishustinae]PNW23567.1 sulfatase [Salegentibacter mishustinae]PZX66649.1 putative sulfatase [Salegentibacter mishustinae]GGW83702.1 N-acetylglucosamine-6-sulfatase [Salegentibacter mishustinae]
MKSKNALPLILSFLFLAISLISCKNNSEEKELDKDQKKKRPNIVFIMTDDHAAQAISAYGHPVSKLAPTPNIDRIANNGVKFNNNFCTNSICGPSRAVILTGKHSHLNGFRMNGETFDGSQPTLPKYLKEAGYQTALFGKWHLHGSPQGFDDWNILVDQGNYYNSDFIKNKDTTRIEGYATDIITEMGLDWLKNNRDKEKPFMLMVQHKAPHRNWMPALRHINKYDSIEFPLPKSYFSDHKGQVAAQEQLQTIYKDMYEGHDLKMTVAKGSDSLRHNPWKTDFERMTKAQRDAWNKAYRPKNNAFHEANLSGKELDKWKGQRYLRDYLATVAAVDEGVGKILDYLEESGLVENTLIVYTTDQGFYLGEKGFFDKRFMYEESLAMPMLMQYPGVIEAGSEIDALTQNLDFAPTFLDFANAEIPEEMQGRSLRSLMNNSISDEDFRNAIYYHYYDFPAFHMVKRHYGIRTDRFKLMHFYDDIDVWEMYDLQKDPREMNNIYNHPDYAEVRKELHSSLDSLQQKYNVTEEEFATTPESKVDQAYRNFARMAGEDPENYPGYKNE